MTETEARDRLPDLIDRALAGEDVRITRSGATVVELRPVAPARMGRVMTQADWEWLDANRVGSRIPKEDAGSLVSRMRDEDWR